MRHVGHWLFSFLGGVEVNVESHVKDLGKRFNYNASIRLGNVKDKIAVAEKRIKKIKNLPLDVQAKACLVQTSIWPMALYSADTAFLGMVHFQTLRAAVVNAFLGSCKFASPFFGVFFAV